MKIILLIATILLFSVVSSKVIEVRRPISRNNNYHDEDYALELIYAGSCKEFRKKVLPTMWISSGEGKNCLPIRVSPTNPDENQLSTSYYCTNKKGRSIIKFVEVFKTSDGSNEDNFVLSLIPSSPFRILTHKTSVARRPNCHTTKDYCNEDTMAVVDRCETNKVRTKKYKKNEYIISQDRIYIISNDQKLGDCKSSGNCCAYIKPRLFNGICDYTAPTKKLGFDKYHDDDHHDDHHDDHKHHNDHDDHDRDHDRDHDKDGHRDGKKGGKKGGNNKPPHPKEDQEDKQEKQEQVQSKPKQGEEDDNEEEKRFKFIFS